MDAEPIVPAPPSAEEGAVHLGNWRLPPYNRQAFRRVRELVPSAGIARGTAPAVPFPRNIRDLDAVAVDTPDGGKVTVGQALADTFTDGFLVLHRGSVVCERYDAGHGPATPHIVFSVSKSITALLAGILAGRGLLHPEAPVLRYLPEAAGSAYGDCTVQHVLDMTVGIAFDESYLAPDGAFARYREATAWNPVTDPARPLDLRGFLVSLRRDAHAHGAVFHYVSPNADILGWIVERAAGQPFADLLSTLLWQPMGAEHDAYVTVDRLGAARAAGGLCMTLRDMARIGELVRCRGLAAEAQIVPGSWIDAIRRGGDRAAWIAGGPHTLLPDGSYRHQWYRIGRRNEAVAAIGIHGQWIYVDPATELVIAKQSSQPLPTDEAVDRLELRLFEAVAAAVA
jgi:CubicO group peptidase (beta-lactamase class C family)